MHHDRDDTARPTLHRSGKQVFDAPKLARDIHVFLDGIEYFEVEEYCTFEGWVSLPTGKARTRTSRPITIAIRGK